MVPQTFLQKVCNYGRQEVVSIFRILLWGYTL